MADAAETPPPAAPSDRPRLRSFDVFDTLIARRCHEPWRIFADLGAKAGIPDFVDHRRKAEARVAGRPYGLDEIYAELGTALGLETDVVEALKRLEIELELDAAIPIAQNIAAVADGDLLVSDMYLPPDVIRGLLARAGFAREVGLVVTSAGKHRGWIWPKLAARVEIAEHLGDNAHSDVASPKAHGIPARHTAVTEPTAIERILIDRGLRDLALVARETRLATWTTTPGHRHLQLVQAGLNFPLLAIAGIVLARRALELGVKRVLFSARDCNLWIHLFADILRRTGLDLEPRYLLTSRLARLRATDDYLAYVSSELAPGALVADICGTGASLARLLPRLDRAGQEVFFVHRVRPQSARVAAPREGAIAITAMIDPSMGEFDNRAFEMANYAGHGMVEDVIAFEGGFAPRFSPETRDAATLAAIAEQRSTFLKALEISRRHRLEDLYTMDDDALVAVARELYGHLCGQKKLFETFAASHTEEDARVMAESRTHGVAL
jgi:hypothetical protein